MAAAVLVVKLHLQGAASHAVLLQQVLHHVRYVGVGEAALERSDHDDGAVAVNVSAQAAPAVVAQQPVEQVVPAKREPVQQPLPNVAATYMCEPHTCVNKGGSGANKGGAGSQAFGPHTWG